MTPLLEGWSSIAPAWSQFVSDTEAYRRKQMDYLSDLTGQEPCTMRERDVSLACAMSGKAALFSLPLSFDHHRKCFQISRQGDVLVGLRLVGGDTEAPETARLTCGGRVMTEHELKVGQYVLSLHDNCIPLVSLAYEDVKLEMDSDSELQLEAVYGYLANDVRSSLVRTAVNTMDQHFADGRASAVTRLPDIT